MKDELKRATEKDYTMWDLNTKWVEVRNRQALEKKLKRKARRKNKKKLQKILEEYFNEE